MKEQAQHFNNLNKIDVAIVNSNRSPIFCQAMGFLSLNILFKWEIFVGWVSNKQD